MDGQLQQIIIQIKSSPPETKEHQLSQSIKNKIIITKYQLVCLVKKFNQDQFVFYLRLKVKNLILDNYFHALNTLSQIIKILNLTLLFLTNSL
jgi:hypothetical protein